MKKSLFFLIVSLIHLTILSLIHLTVNAQSLPKDSLYFVHLRDGSTLYSNNVRLVNPSFHDKYLLLDSSRHLPLSQVKDFKGWDGAFAVDSINGYYDAYKLQNEGRRISLYSQCYYTTETVWTSTTPGGPQIPTTITTHEKALYFRKGPDGNIQRLDFDNLIPAMADNPASTHELKIGQTNLHLGIGLIAGGVALSIAGFIMGKQRSEDAQNAFKTASDNWFNAARNNPFGPIPNPPSPPPTYGPHPLFIIGAATLLSAMIPLFNTGKHAQKALDIYNGIE